MPREPRWFAVAGEDQGHFDVVTFLTDRVLEKDLAWFRAAKAEHRRFRGPDARLALGGRSKRALADARALRLPTHGHFDGKPGKEDAGMVRAQLLLWQHAHLHGSTLDVCFLVRDTDGHEDRIDGAVQAAGAGAWPFRLVLAHPDPEIEAWSIAGFEPSTKPERDRSAAVSKRLGFRPWEKPEQLTSTVPGDPRDAKAILDELTGADAERARQCLEVDLDTLRARGKGCGLAALLLAVESDVLPLFMDR